MTMSALRSPRILIPGGIILLLVAAVVWALTDRTAEARKTTLPEHLSVEALKARAANPGALRETLRQEELTEEQRRELARNMRDVFRSQMDERVGEYFAAADEDKDSVLDRHIDEFQKRMAEWEKRRNEEEPRSEENRENMRNMFGNRTKQERKADSESRNPDQTAQRMAYFSALRERMSKRGIEMPQRGGFGGPGGGRGGPGRGP